MASNPPTRFLIFLDIRNIFNEISRERALYIINTHFPHLSHIANTLLIHSTTCYYLTPNGRWISFQQEEGIPQWCSLRPVLAVFFLNLVIRKLDEDLRKRAAARKVNKILLDDQEGGITNLLVFVDDLNAVVPHQYCLYYCNTFKLLVNYFSLQFRTDKSKILTSTNDHSSIAHLPRESKTTLTAYLKEYTMGT